MKCIHVFNFPKIIEISNPHYPTSLLQLRNLPKLRLLLLLLPQPIQLPILMLLVQLAVTANAFFLLVNIWHIPLIHPKDAVGNLHLVIGIQGVQNHLGVADVVSF